ISMLPSEPKIFHGRESELSDILKTFGNGKPRIAILVGAGGIGKSTLARAVLHHEEIIRIFQHWRFFVVCDSVSSKLELAGLIGAHLGLKPGKDLTRAIIKSFSNNPPCLLILDNLETLWEVQESKGDIEEFLSLLTDIQHLALVITMRGAERPAKVRWTRPFSPPLKPLEQDAARKTFIDIAGDDHDREDIEKILFLTDNMPLAIDLMAHVAEAEGCSSVLSRWVEEKTSVLSEGFDRGSNLDLSISLSLSSPRMTSPPHSQELLSLLVILPDGLSDVELLQCELPIKDPLGCKAALLRTSLVYMDAQKRVKTLSPIREYMQKYHPVSPGLVRPLLQYFQELLELYESQSG
ncbi:P-loop containing nucleoside triphosphate hydrolase protein, partial [Mycena albidolilacea]